MIVHTLLIGSAFDGWHGLFTQHPFLGPLLVSSLVCVAWIAVSVTASWQILRRRDFLTGTVSVGRNWIGPIRMVAIATAVIVVLALGTGLGPTDVTAYRVASTIGPEFDNLTLLQQALIGRHAPPGAKLDIEPSCNRRGARAIGPGDWNCSLYVYLPQPNSVPFQLTSVEYDVSVEYNGCYKAQSRRRSSAARQCATQPDTASPIRCSSCTAVSTCSRRPLKKGCCDVSVGCVSGGLGICGSTVS